MELSVPQLDYPAVPVNGAMGKETDASSLRVGHAPTSTILESGTELGISAVTPKSGAKAPGTGIRKLRTGAVGT